MKLLLAIINDDDANEVNNALRDAGFSATKISSTGGFLMSGNTTFLIGIEDSDVEKACEIISANSQKRSISLPSSMRTADKSFNPSEKVVVGGATVFVLGVEECKRL